MARNLQFKKDKRALSTIVITVILIALSMAAVVLVWGFVNNLIKKQIGSSESCFGNYDKITLNKQYTCYDSDLQEFRFSLSIGDVTADKVIVSVSSASEVKSYEITNEEQTITGLENYPSGTTTIKLPVKNAGLTYSASGFTSVVDLVRIAPAIGGTQCEISDSLSQIEDCSLLV
ncbi:MAG: hypothetical protein M1416_02230 [Candidatus Pacearchaeota archaeon]|nr:hypothetical protein [Candidatus Pacearchaeota archaeon]